MTSSAPIGSTTSSPTRPAETAKRRLKGAVVRFAGDSGDGMQVTGDQFTSSTALAGNDLATFPDFPAEIRAPAGTTYGVSGFQIHFASESVFTPGDAADVLVVMNPAALKTNLKGLVGGGLLVVNTGSFSKANLKKAGYEENPLETDAVSGYEVLAVDISKNTQAAVKEAGLSNKEANRCKNFWTLGLMFWIYDRDLSSTISFLETKFKTKPAVAQANILALKAGHAYGETAEIAHFRAEVPAAPTEPGLYRNIGGNTATAWGLVAAAELSGLQFVMGAYPITPASDVLHELSRHKRFGIHTIQAEDEIAAICAAIGASYAGSLGITATSGPGVALKSEALGLAVSAELPLVLIDIQRGGPSTGLPTKTEQSDLFQALYGRNGEAPVAVIAAQSPSDCFAMAIEAVRLTTKYMTPVILLTDGYLANGTEPWKIPDVESLPKIDVQFRTDPEGFHPFVRDPETLARAWAVPGTPGLRHRIGGLEKDYDSGHISYDPENHERMSRVRRDKIQKMAHDIALQTTEEGPASGEMLVLGWGSTYGAIRESVRQLRAAGHAVSHAHLRYINPLPSNLEQLLSQFQKVVVPELNLGQLATVLRGKFARPLVSVTKIQGQPFGVEELTLRLQAELQK